MCLYAHARDGISCVILVSARAGRSELAAVCCNLTRKNCPCLGVAAMARARTVVRYVQRLEYRIMQRIATGSCCWPRGRFFFWFGIVCTIFVFGAGHSGEWCTDQCGCTASSSSSSSSSSTFFSHRYLLFTHTRLRPSLPSIARQLSRYENRIFCW